MTEHRVKCWPAYFKDVALGHKNFEVRVDDRDYQPGDYMVLREWDERGGYSGREARARITYVLPGGAFGIQEGHCVLALADVRTVSYQDFERDCHTEGSS